VVFGVYFGGLNQQVADYQLDAKFLVAWFQDFAMPPQLCLLSL